MGFALTAFLLIGMQLLQCIRRADTGGSNYLVNASHAALYLREIDPNAYYLLTTVPVHFHRKQKEFQSIHIGPIIETDGDEIKQIRHSYFTLAPFHLPFWLTIAYYNAYRKYASILYDPQSQYRVLLERGDFVLYDNYKMLHAREGFTGPRHLRGIYFRHTDVWNKLDKFSKDKNVSCQK
jgi:gamma-butyrobetaine dioxygenase/trimethyllysine dioxygenase